jgi:hypothetical protein
MGLEWIGLDQQQFVNANLIGKLILRLISGHKKMHALRRATDRLPLVSLAIYKLVGIS